MAKGKIEQEIALKVTGAKDVKEAEKLVDKFDGKTAEVTIDVDDKASKDIKSIDELVEGLTEKQRTIVLKAQADQAERDIKKLTGQIGRAKDVDTIQIKVDLLDTATDRLAEINSQLEKLDGQTVDIDTRTAVSGIDSIGRSADSSKSVLANMIGNATQDLGALSGVAGSAGVAIGQMGEYMADARASGEGFGTILKNFSGVALPIAGLSVGVAVITDIIKKAGEMGRKINEASKIAVSSMLDVAEAGKTLGEGLDDVAESAVENIFEELGAKAPGVVDALERMGITWDEVVEGFRTGKGDLADALGEYDRFLSGKALYGERQAKLDFAERLGLGPAEADALLGRLKSINDAFGTSFDVESQAAEAARAAGEYRAEAIDATEASAEATEAATTATEANATALERAQARSESFATAQEDAATAQQALVDATNDYRDALNDQFTAMTGIADLSVRVADAQEAFAEAATEANGLLKENGDLIDNSAEGQKAYADAVDRQRDAAVTAAKAAAELSQQQAEANGEFFTGVNQLDIMNDSLLAQARYATPAARRAIIDYLIEMNQIPADKATEIQALIDQGKFDEAEAMIAEVSKAREVAVTAVANTTAAETEIQKLIQARNMKINVDLVARGSAGYGGRGELLDAGGTAGGLGGIAGERGPEIVDGRYLVTGPTYVPPGSRVTSRVRTTQILRQGRHRFRTYDQGGVVQPVNNINVKVNLPAGADGADVVRQVKRYQRRNGSLL